MNNFGFSFLYFRLANPVLECSLYVIEHLLLSVLNLTLEQAFKMLLVLYYLKPLLNTSLGFDIIVSLEGVGKHSLSLGF